MNRSEIFQLVQRQLETNIEELTQALENYRAASDLDEADTRDLEDFSQQSENKEMQLQMEGQVENAREQLTRLQELADEISDTAGVGSLVETDKNIFLLGLSLSPMMAADKEVIGISVQSPAYAIINDKQKGESISLGNNKHTILGIY